MTESEQIEEIEKILITGCGNTSAEDCEVMSCHRCRAKTLCNANYRKVERGEWELNIDGSHWCSECGHNATYTYDGTEVCGVSCPFCGADMRGATDEKQVD